MGKRLTVILGAGASNDLGVSGRAQVEQEYQPPLARDLFKGADTFLRILNHYPRARSLAAPIADRMSRNEDLESVLRSLRDSPNEHTVRAFWQIPLYLQELFAAISEHYTSEPTNYSILVHELLGSAYEKVAFVTLNYDLLLEKSLEGFATWNPRDLSDYIGQAPNWMLVKLHGSANWGKRVLNVPLDVPDMDHALKLVDKLSLDGAEFSEIEITDLRRWITPPEGGFNLIYPSLTVPVEDKDEYSCPKAHIETLKEFLSSCPHYLIIGVSGKDQDLLDLLKENVRTCGAVTIVGDEHVHDAWGRFHDAVRPFRDTRVLPMKCERGFSEFIASGDLDKSLSRVQ